MLKNKRWLLVGVIAAMLVMAACAAPTPTTTEAPATAAATEVATAAPTEAPTEAGTPVPPTPTPYVQPTEPIPTTLKADCGGTSSINEITAVDPKTVKFTLCGPDPSFLAKIALPSYGIEPKAHLEKVAWNNTVNTDVIGTGPYVMDTWTAGESIILKRNDNYWGTKPAQASLVFRWNSEPAARLLAVQSGEADAMDNVGKDDTAKVAADSTLQLKPRDPMTIVYVGMTNTFKPWDNPDVRKALAMGIDRQRFLDNYFPTGTQLADYFTPCIIPNGCTGDKWYGYDAAAAKAAIDKAVPGGITTHIYFRDVTRPYAEGFPVLAQELQTQLKAIDITADLVPMQSSDFIKQATTGKLDGLFLLGWTADYPHITNFLDAHFSAGVETFGKPDDELVKDLADAAKLPVDKAKDAYTKANNRLREVVPMVPLVHSVSSVAYKADVKGAYASPLSNENFALMDAGGRDTFVFIQGAEPGGLYAADKSDGESLHVAQHITEGLYTMTAGAAPDPTPALATECKDDGTLTVWTCTLRDGVKFSDGTPLTADDVAASLIIAWDASSPYHVGAGEGFYYIDALFGMINKPKE